MTRIQSSGLALALAALLVCPHTAFAQEPSSLPTASPDVGFTVDPSRPVQGRDAISDAVAPQVPQRGIYAAGGGMTSSAWRVIINLDDASIEHADSEADGSSSVGEMDENQQWALEPAELSALIALADAAWREDQPPVEDPTADYGELVILADGDAVRVIQPFGPAVAPHTRALIDALLQESE